MSNKFDKIRTIFSILVHNLVIVVLCCLLFLWDTSLLLLLNKKLLSYSKVRDRIRKIRLLKLINGFLWYKYMLTMKLKCVVLRVFQLIKLVLTSRSFITSVLHLGLLGDFGTKIGKTIILEFFTLVTLSFIYPICYFIYVDFFLGHLTFCL